MIRLTEREEGESSGISSKDFPSRLNLLTFASYKILPRYLSPELTK